MDIEKHIKNAGYFPNFNLNDKISWQMPLLKEFIKQKDNGTNKLDPTDYDEATYRFLDLLVPNYYAGIEPLTFEETLTYAIIAAYIHEIEMYPFNHKQPEEITHAKNVDK